MGIVDFEFDTNSKRMVILVVHFRHHCWEARIAVALFSSSPLSCNSVHCDRDWIFLAGTGLLTLFVQLITPAVADNIITSFVRRSQTHASLCICFKSLSDKVIYLCACHAVLTIKI